MRLEGDERLEPLEHLSQSSAVGDILPSIKGWVRGLWVWISSSSYRRRRAVLGGTDTLGPGDSSVISPWFGIFALLNVAVFSVLGVVLPYVLSDGALGAPLVRRESRESVWTPGASTAAVERIL